MSHLHSILNPESSRKQQLSVTTLPEDERSSSADQRSSSADDEVSPTSSDEVDELDDESEQNNDEEPHKVRPDNGKKVSGGDENHFTSRKEEKKPQKPVDPYHQRQPTAPRKHEKHDRKIDLGPHDHKAHADCPDTLACLPDTVGRPQHTLPVILRCAILGSPRKRLTIREIYAAMESKYPFYKSAGQTWKQSVRHHLSLNRLFERQPRSVTDPGFGSYWTVNLDTLPGTKRPRKRGRPNREAGEGSSRKTTSRAQAQPQIRLHGQPQNNLPPQPTQFQFQPPTHPTPPLPPQQQLQVQFMNSSHSPSLHSPTRSHQQSAPHHQSLPTRQQTLQHQHQPQASQQSHHRHQSQQLSPVHGHPPTPHQQISQSQHQQQPQPHMQQTRHSRQSLSIHQHQPQHQRQPSHHGQPCHQNQSSHPGQSPHQNQPVQYVKHQSQDHPLYNQHHHSHQQPREPEPLHRYHPPPPVPPRIPSTPSTPLSGRESNFPPSSSSETEDGGRLTHEEGNGPTVSDDEHESEEDMSRPSHSRQPSGQSQPVSMSTRPSTNLQAPPFLEPTREDTLKQMREEIASLHRTYAEAVSTSIRLSEQLANANLEVSRSREAVRDLEDMLQSEVTKRNEAERLKDIEIERRRAAEQALNGISVRSPTRPRLSGSS